MLKYIIQILFIFIFTSLFSQNIHNTNKSVPTAWNSFTQTTIFHTFIFPKEFNNNYHFLYDEGDYIGVFYKQQGSYYCCGYSTIDTTANFFMIGYADDPMSEEKDGFATGDTIYFKIYKSKFEYEIEILVGYLSHNTSDTSGIFHNMAVSIINYIKHKITINDTNHHQRKDITVLPNPFNNQIYIFNNQSNSFNIKIYNLHTELVFERTFNNYGQFTISSANWKSGLYIARISYSNKTMIYKLIKQ